MYRYILKEHRLAICSLNFCFYCQSYTGSVNVEHITPIILGGTSELSNLTGACSRCNSYKSSFPIDVFLSRIIEKRQKLSNSIYGYINVLRAIRKGTKHSLPQDFCIKKINDARKKHSYFTSIIDSINNKKYIYSNK